MEILSLKPGDLAGKGGKRGRRELPAPAHDATQTWLHSIGLDVATMPSSASLWPPLRGSASTEGITAATFYGRFRWHLRAAGLPETGVHVLRHTAAKLRRDAGASIEEIGQFLDHSSLTVTTNYLRRLEGVCDPRWQAVVAGIRL